MFMAWSRREDQLETSVTQSVSAVTMAWSKVDTLLFLGGRFAAARGSRLHHGLWPLASRGSSRLNVQVGILMVRPVR